MTTIVKTFLTAGLFLIACQQVFAQSAVTRTGNYDAGGVTEYSQYLYIAPGTHVTIPAGQQWIIASQYIFIAPTAVIDGGGQIVIDDPGNFGTLSESVAWAGQPTTIDGGNSRILAQVVNRNPSNIVLGSVDVAPSWGDITTANTDHTLYIGSSLAWATTHDDGSAFTGNDILLGDNDLKFATAAIETGYRPDAFAVTNGTGHVVKENYTGNWIFPVGIAEGDYTPAAINNAAANGIHVLVQNYTASIAAEPATNNGINRSWNIYADNATTGGSTVQLQHNTATDGTAFRETGHFVTQWGSTSPNNTGNLPGFNNWQRNTTATADANPGNMQDPVAAVTGSSMRQRIYGNTATNVLATTAAAANAWFTKLTDMPDLTPLLTLDPNVIHGNQNFDARVRIFNTRSTASSGTITVFIPKNSKWSFTWSPTGTSFAGLSASNASWTYTATASYHVWTTSSVIAAGGSLSFGFTAAFVPGATNGHLPITVQIQYPSGGEDYSGNNTDDESISFFQN